MNLSVTMCGGERLAFASVGRFLRWSKRQPAGCVESIQLSTEAQSPEEAQEQLASFLSPTKEPA